MLIEYEIFGTNYKKKEKKGTKGNTVLIPVLPRTGSVTGSTTNPVENPVPLLRVSPRAYNKPCAKYSHRTG